MLMHILDVSQPKIEQATFRILPATENESSDEVSFGEYFPVQDVTRNERGNKEEFSYPTGVETSIRNPDYSYNILVLPEHLSNLDAQNKIYFEPKKNSISHVPVNDTYNVEASAKAELRNNKDNINITPENGPISTEIQSVEPIGNEDRSYTDQQHHEEPFHGQQYQYDNHHEDPSHGQHGLHHYEPHHEQGVEHYDPGQPTAYAYNYHVNGYPSGPIFSKHENSDGFLTRGEYSVKLPDGRTQTVSYSVKGEGGFTVNVRYSGNSIIGLI